MYRAGAFWRALGPSGSAREAFLGCGSEGDARAAQGGGDPEADADEGEHGGEEGGAADAVAAFRLLAGVEPHAAHAEDDEEGQEDGADHEPAGGACEHDTPGGEEGDVAQEGGDGESRIGASWVHGRSVHGGALPANPRVLGVVNR